ncbi:restriction endonuclease subunit S [Hufsiella ginkgonis]|uniref:Type I restriction modification DNA specificity domain-containing protein n=1 Tax=Hufsiella ginkgonis TaxID=2695274 RepID=A0A7K1XTV8_9SPHI|nr:restriction endonuclease subunit S [Hufsiella ginkgonis]MXV14412.1 hypothetical protein [Hufsiella ginkgonis]
MKTEFTDKFIEELLVNEKGALISGPFGSDISSKFFTQVGVPVIRGNNLSKENIKFIDDGFAFVSEKKADELDAYAIKDDIVFTAAGTIGQVGIIDETARYSKYIISNKQIRVRLDKTKVLPLYAYYWLSSPWIVKNLIAKNTGSTVPLINLGVIRKLNIRIPKQKIIEENIVRILSSIDDKILLNREISTNLDGIAKTVYDYWFLQFDFPNSVGKPFKSSGGKMTYNSKLGCEIPEDWTVTSITECIDHDKSGDWGKEYPEGNNNLEVACIRGADINGLNGVGEIKAPVRFILSKNSHKLLETHDVIVEISGGSPTQSTGRLGFVTEETLERFDKPLICSNFCKAVSLKNKKQLFHFAQSWNNAYQNGVLFGFEGKTSGIKNLLFDSFVNSYQIAGPPDHLIEQFYNLILPFHKQQQNLLKQNLELAQLRDWLLPMLMNGQATVGENATITENQVNQTSQNDTLCIAPAKQGFAKQTLAGNIISLFKDDPHFTDIKFQKVQFLAEHIAEADLNLNYYYQAAGPYDNKFMHTIHTDLKKNQWFDKVGKKYVPLAKQNKIQEYFQGYFAPAQQKLNTLFGLLQDTTEAEAEIIATTYAVWNNRLIEKRTSPDNELIEDFFKWSERKQQYSAEQVKWALHWLRENKFEPKGFGKLIKKAKSKSGATA